MHRLSKRAATRGDLNGDSSSLTANRHQFMEPARTCAVELLSCNSGTRVDDPATAELLAMLGISASVPSEVAIDCAPVELRI